MTFKEYCGYIKVKDKYGREAPIKLTKVQEEFVNFMDWCDKNECKNAVFLGNKIGKAYFLKLYNKYKEEKNAY